MNVYDVDTRIQTNVAFLDWLTQTPIDPTAINLFVSLPDGTTTEYAYPATITRTGDGTYTCQFILTEVGIWVYKWQGTGTAEVSSPDTRMLVSNTQFNLSP